MALVAERGGYPMMQNSIVAVGLAILTALTIVAYRHPDVFSKLALALLLIALAFMIGAEAFNFGTMAAREAISASKDLDSVDIKSRSGYSRCRDPTLALARSARRLYAVRAVLDEFPLAWADPGPATAKALETRCRAFASAI